MGFPIAKIKDPAKTFPIKAMSVYVLVDEELLGKYSFEDISRQFKRIVTRPSNLHLPIEYHLLRRTHKKDYLGGRVNDILTKLHPFNTICRDVEIEQQFVQKAESSDFSIGYICGEIDWSLPFGLEMGFQHITRMLLLEIEATAQKIIDFSTDNFNEIQIEAAKRIIDICKEAMKIHKGFSKQDLRPYSEELRRLLDDTTIIRKLTDEYSDEMTISAFEDGLIRNNKYGIVLKKSGNKYVINLRIGEKRYPIKSTQQSACLFFFAIAFAFIGETLDRGLLTLDLDKPISPAELKKLAKLNNCYAAFKGVNAEPGNLADLLNAESGELSLEFKEFYKRLAYDGNGNYDDHRLNDLLSKINRIIIRNTIKGMSQEVYQIFKLQYNTINGKGVYHLNIPRDCIHIDDSSYFA